MTQNERILEYLRSHDGITTMEAGDKLRIFRLSERIRELESEGFKFSHTPETTQNARVIRYRLLKAAPQVPDLRGAGAMPTITPAGAAPNTGENCKLPAGRVMPSTGLPPHSNAASSPPHEQLIHREYTDKKGKAQRYAYIAVGFAEKPAW